ncbi:MAG TPA: SDR family oxidoreductase [Pseudonocardiaceae bacterium]|jgi:NAD(P)-dependent dehydrogenase (short-subunit alcohol dehydrogenase family)|nr:SDR family oxidoreductase [Pseudonocardiaceae bacterium]
MTTPAPRTGRLAGKVAVVTGGASGIGKGAADLMRAEGAQVCVTDIVLPDVATPEQITHDVSAEADWQRVHDHVLATFGRVDVLVNSAGIFREGMIADIPLDTWHRMVAVNQTGILLGMRTFADALARDGGGSIINLSSHAGMQGQGSSIAYQATKWAVRGMTRFAAREFAPRDIRVNAIVPGFIDTPMVQAATQRLRESAVRRTPLGRLGDVSDVAAAILYFASDDSGFVTGTELVVDGGILA